MNKLYLTEAVTVEGKDVWGRRGWIRFSPSRMSGWHWKTSSGETVAIDKEIVAYNKWLRFISLSYGGHSIHIWEHIGVLRFFGLDGILVESSPWPPYHGRAFELWRALYPHARRSEEMIPWCTPEYDAEWHYGGVRQGGYTRIVPILEKKLGLTVTADYEGIGAKTIRFTIDSRIPFELASNMDPVIEAHSQGWPRRRYWFCLLLQLLGWPHFYNVTWPQHQDSRQTIELFARHRVGDLLGALSLLSHDKLPACMVWSVKSGHEADLHVLEKMSVRAFSGIPMTTVSQGA